MPDNKGVADVNLESLGEGSNSDDNNKSKDSLDLSDLEPDLSSYEDEDTGSDEIDDYFDLLEREVDGAIFDEPAEKKTDNKVDSGEEGSDISDPKKELENVKARYESSSKEAKRLKSKLDQLEQYEDFVPLLKVMREDPGLIATVQQYLEDGGTINPKNVRQELGVDEDFVFDYDEAVNDPNSPSAKFLEKQIDRKVSERIQQSNAQTQRERLLEAQRKELKDKFGVDDGEIDETLEWAKGHQLTMEDIYLLKNRDSRDKQIVSKALQARRRQASKMADTPRSLGSVGKASDGEPSDEAKLMLAMKKLSDGGDIFGP